MILRLVTLSLLYCALGASLVLAQSDTREFTVGVSGGSDTEAPGTPNIVSVIPVATTQIDVTWGAVTDNVIVSGYVVFRDSVPIATTTQTNYSDTGLSASTTYSYTVRAFDPARNYSSSSVAVATTTLEAVAPPDPPDPPVVADASTVSTAARPVLTEFTMTPAISAAQAVLEFARPVRVEVRWGQSTAYELGASVGGVYSTIHQVRITDLTPATTYYYEVVATMPSGVSQVVREGQFTTEGNARLYAPANVERFAARPDGQHVVLTWRLPQSVPGAQVRIVRNYYNFPAWPTDGIVVYQGDGTTVRDEDILSLRSPVYYTAFVYDAAGNVSSGAVALVYSSDTTAVGSDTATAPSGQSDFTNLPEDVFTTTPTSTIDTEAAKEIITPLLSEIYLVQDSAEWRFDNADIILSPNLEFVISIPKTVVGGAFKSIIATVVDPSDTRQSFSYLLRINADQTAYEAVVAPMGVNGASTVSIDIYNFRSLTVAKYRTPVQFSARGTETAPTTGLMWWMPYVVGGILVLLLLWLLLAVLARRDHREDNWQQRR